MSAQPSEHDPSNAIARVLASGARVAVIGAPGAAETAAKAAIRTLGGQPVGLPARPSIVVVFPAASPAERDQATRAGAVLVPAKTLATLAAAAGPQGIGPRLARHAARRARRRGGRLRWRRRRRRDPAPGRARPGRACGPRRARAAREPAAAVARPGPRRPQGGRLLDGPRPPRERHERPPCRAPEAGARRGGAGAREVRQGAGRLSRPGSGSAPVAEAPASHVRVLGAVHPLDERRGLGERDRERHPRRRGRQPAVDVRLPRVVGRERDVRAVVPIGVLAPQVARDTTRRSGSRSRDRAGRRA